MRRHPQRRQTIRIPHPCSTRDLKEITAATRARIAKNNTLSKEEWWDMCEVDIFVATSFNTLTSKNHVYGPGTPQYEESNKHVMDFVKLLSEYPNIHWDGPGAEESWQTKGYDEAVKFPSEIIRQRVLPVLP